MLKFPLYLNLPMLVGFLLFFSSLVVHADGVLEDASKAFDSAWSSTKKAAGEAADWSEDKAKKGWESTKQGADKTWQVTKEKSSDATKWSKEQAGDGLDATKEGAGKAWQGIKKATGSALLWTSEKTRQAGNALTRDADNTNSSSNRKNTREIAL